MFSLPLLRFLLLGLVEALTLGQAEPLKYTNYQTKVLELFESVAESRKLTEKAIRSFFFNISSDPFVEASESKQGPTRH